MANTGPVACGCVGAGTGAWSGSIKGGLGSASQILDSGITVAALLAVNSAGSVINPGTGRLWEIGHSAADCVSRAIIKAILTASSLADKTAFCDLELR